MITFSNIFSSETTGTFEAKFDMGNQFMNGNVLNWFINAKQTKHKQEDQRSCNAQLTLKPEQIFPSLFPSSKFDHSVKKQN